MEEWWKSKADLILAWKFSRKNLPEILDVEEMLENRLQELSVPFKPTLVFPEVVVTTCELHTQ